ncbi:MurR/RpiR family transcriptional regulator [Amphibacillus sediminis]|uniref:MurR/RpiR family transcriptional regulator n=1 Tax=Amphibacillus sediminis TaxID=360185 RepID=UPI0008310636|nr:MurR/RpiR family transcriptional regulator [Amphibacillus sediminis]
MNINNLGLLNTLATIINDGERDSDYAITEFILNNIDNVSHISNNMIMDEAFVSRSAIRRFCNRLGYKNFSELKNSLSDIIFPSNIHLREFEHVKAYRKKMNQELAKMIEDINQLITDQVLDQLVDLINDYQDISIISANNTSSNLLKFQQELFYAKKIIRLVNHYYDNNNLKDSFGQSSLVFVVSVSGIFAKAINDIMHGISGKKILITANRNEAFVKSYDQIIYISKNDILWNDNLGLYGKYGITYFFDLLSEHYIYKYKKNKG